MGYIRVPRKQSHAFDSFPLSSKSLKKTMQHEIEYLQLVKKQFLSSNDAYNDCKDYMWLKVQLS